MQNDSGEGIVTIFSGRKTGRCSTGAERDGGTVLHAVRIPFGEVRDIQNWEPALCGTMPGQRGNGWDLEKGRKITCSRCLEKLARLEKI